MNKTIPVYVYDNVEVRLTRRKASKKLKSGTINELVEITPLNPVSLSSAWTKWVKMTDLFEIENSQDSVEYNPTEDRSTW